MKPNVQKSQIFSFHFLPSLVFFRRPKLYTKFHSPGNNFILPPHNIYRLTASFTIALVEHRVEHNLHRHGSIFDDISFMASSVVIYVLDQK